VCVPISQLPRMVSFARKILSESRLKGGILGHVGDGNFHTLILYDDQSNEEVQAVNNINEQLVYKALEVGGTCTGEHGDGIGKRKYQSAEHGNAFSMMKNIKSLVAPEHVVTAGNFVSDQVIRLRIVVPFYIK